jgi:hypothetical protein
MRRADGSDREARREWTVAAGLGGGGRGESAAAADITGSLELRSSINKNGRDTILFFYKWKGEERKERRGGLKAGDVASSGWTVDSSRKLKYFIKFLRFFVKCIEH